ncbi:MAG: YdcF family protein [Deltaproteobacteria bacterium]|nr:YdcF family protein [Deltaproteobacteria bacterium]
MSVGLAVAGVYYFPQWLAVSDPVAPADALIVLGGDATRAIDAAKYFRQGIAPIVYISQPVVEASFRRLEEFGIIYPREADVARAVLIANGVPESQIRSGSDPVISTVEEAEALERRLPESAQRVLLVTSPYHVRRTRFIFRRAMPGRVVSVVASTAELYPRRWWTRQDVARAVVLEGMKFAFYLLGGRFYAH